MAYRELKYWPYYPAQLLPCGATLENTVKGTYGWVVIGVSQGSEEIAITVKKGSTKGVIKYTFDQTVYVNPYL